jgi:hypothetical protein
MRNGYNEFFNPDIALSMALPQLHGIMNMECDLDLSDR